MNRKVKVKCKSCGLEYMKEAQHLKQWNGDCLKCARAARKREYYAGRRAA